METVEVVIKVPKDLYEGIERRNGELETEYVCDELMKAIDNGTVLPKGHGRLIDVDELIKWLKLYNDRYNKRFAKTPIKDISMYDLGHRNRNDDIILTMDRFSTIIEADRGGE